MESKPTVEEIVEINQLLALWGHILDSHKQERYAEVLMDDCFYDCSIFGFETAMGIEAIQHIFKQEGHAKAHHTTNIYISKNSESDFKVISKGLGLLADGSVASLTFLDIVKASSNGMRLSSRILKFL